MDIYESLIGAAPTSPVEIAAVVEALRRRRKVGELGAITGDRVMAPVGQGLSKQADAYAEMLQDTRQKDIDNAQTKAYQTGQLEHMGNVLKETLRYHDMSDATQRRGQDKAVEAAGIRRTANGKSPRMRQGDIQTLRDNAMAQGTVGELLAFLQKGGKPDAQGNPTRGTLGAVGGIPIIGSYLRQTLNAAAAKGAGTEATKATAMKWQQYQRFYELAERNRMFGQTLTPNEQAAWRKANPSFAQTDEQIEEGLKIMQKVYDKAQNDFKLGLKTEGYSDAAIEAYAGGRDAAAEGSLGTEVPDGFDMDGAIQYLMQHPETQPQFEEMLQEMGLDPSVFLPAME